MVPTMYESLFWALIQIYSLNSHKNPVKSRLLLFPLYRWKLGHRYLTCQNPHGFDTTESILQHGGETQAFPRTTRNETDCIRRVRGVTIYWPHHPSLRPAQYHIRRSTLHLRVDIHIPPTLWVTSGESPLWFCLTGIMGTLVASAHWDSNCEKGGRRGFQQPVLGSVQVDMQCPRRSPNQWLCSYAEPRQWCSLTRKLDKVHAGLPDLGTQIKSLATSGTWSDASPRQGSWVTALFTAECSSKPHTTRNHDQFNSVQCSLKLPLVTNLVTQFSSILKLDRYSRA